MLPSSATCPLNSVSDLQPVVCTFPAFLPLFIHYSHAFALHTDAYLVSAVMLAALLQCAPGAPVVDAPTDSPAGDTSGEEGEEGETSSGLESNSGLWKSLSGASEQHKQQVRALSSRNGIFAVAYISNVLIKFYSLIF